MAPKIAVIGSGPAGITAALELKDRGFEDVTIFGSFEEAQLKTKQVDGIVFDVAACLLHLGYRNTVIPLTRRFGLEVNYIKAPADIVTSRLEKIKKRPGEIIDVYLTILYYLFFFFGWLFLHKTPFRKRYSSSMETFLVQRRLEGLSKSFAMGPGGIAQGYGFLDEVTAYHAFRWFRPRLFLTPLVSRFKFGVATIKQGYEVLFKNILSELNHVESKIKLVRPSFEKVEVSTQEGEILLFDEVIIACPLDQINFPHAYLIDENTIEESYLFSYLFTSPTIPPFEDRAYLSAYIECKMKNKALVIRTGGQTKTGDYLYWAVGYKSSEISKQDLKSQIERQLSKECNLIIKKLHYFDVFRYNLRFSSQAVRDGVVDKFHNLQGYKHIWYSGGLLSHWDISSIYEHNRWLVNKMRYRLGNKNLFSYLKYKFKTIVSWLRLI